MNKSEVIKLFKEMDKYYLNRMNLSGERLKETVDAYHLILSQYETHVVLSNFAKHVSTSPHPPTVADLVKQPEQQVGQYIPNLEETRLMIEERDREFENHKPADPEFIKKVVAEANRKLMEVRLNELERQNRASREYRFGE